MTAHPASCKSCAHATDAGLGTVKCACPAPRWAYKTDQEEPRELINADEAQFCVCWRPAVKHIPLAQATQALTEAACDAVELADVAHDARRRDSQKNSVVYKICLTNTAEYANATSTACLAELRLIRAVEAFRVAKRLAARAAPDSPESTP
jgi:hypothetical protein